MTVAVDTNVLFDVLSPDSPYHESSEQALAEAGDEGALVISEVVYAELAAYFGDIAGLEAFFIDTRVMLTNSDREALLAAGIAWRR